VKEMPNAQLQHKKIAFLDRDGVINKKAPPHEYITSVNDFVFNEGIFEVVETLKDEGFEFVVVTNQRGISRGLLTKETLADIHTKMTRVFAERDIRILDVFYCPHSENSCNCRKPKPGLLEQACAKYNVDISQSILISDTEEDVSMGTVFGLQSYLVPADQPEVFLQSVRKKIRIAFIKYGGLSSGGTEKMLQIIAANLPKDRFDVDYFYCDSSPYVGTTYTHPTTDENRVAYMRDQGVNCIKFNVEAKDVTHPYHIWINTDFWEKFAEKNYDIIQTGRAGHKEYPFVHIKNTPIIDVLALTGGVDNQYNIARVMHICNWNAEKWTRAGGDKKRIEIISLPVDIKNPSDKNMRSQLNLEDVFVYGMHQRPSNDIFSPLPLLAYKRIENEHTAFVLLGGGDAYQKQARELGIKNIHFIPASGDNEIIFSFLQTLDVYAHGRKDGEINSQAMAEAMFFGLPIASHLSEYNNGHVECIADAGVVVDSVEAYAAELKRLMNDTEYYKMRSKNALRRFAENYELSGQMKRIEAIYDSVITDPFPHPLRRFLYSLHWTQNIRIWLKWVYLKTKYALNGKI
jgi:D-glycero-D-manno-heptose 1,7-bisphosphate phosphatase